MTLEHRSSDEEDALLSALTAEESLAGLTAEAPSLAGLTAEAPSPAGLTARERALVAYADALTRAPGLVRRSHIEALRAAGLDDRAIHDACAIVAYFAFVNRIADGLGVELET